MRTDDSGVDNIGALLYFHYPNTWNHWMGDHAISFQMLPLGKNKTQLVTRWLVPEDAVEGVDYDLDHLTHVWIQTNAQDAALVAECQIGTQSPGYQPGPYSDIEENGVCQFVDWYCDYMTKKLKPIIPLKTVAS
jgi:glycine betaine catabolism A